VPTDLYLLPLLIAMYSIATLTESNATHALYIRALLALVLVCGGIYALRRGYRVIELGRGDDPGESFFELGLLKAQSSTVGSLVMLTATVWAVLGYWTAPAYKSSDVEVAAVERMELELAAANVREMEWEEKLTRAQARAPGNDVLVKDVSSKLGVLVSQRDEALMQVGVLEQRISHMAEQNELIETQNEAIMSQLQKIDDPISAQREQDYRIQKATLISTIYDTVRQPLDDNNGWQLVPSSSVRARSNAVRALVMLKSDQDNVLGADWIQANLSGLRLEHANLEDVKLRGVDLRYARLRGAKLGTANLQGADLQGADLQDANLQGTDLRSANIQEADLQHANLQNATLWDADLRYANLQGANLRDADFWDAYLQGADLRYANLQGANFQYANLQYADLQGADLRRVNLQGANLEDANLEDADLRGANLRGAVFQFTSNTISIEVDEAYWDESTKWPRGFTPPTLERLPPPSEEDE